VPNGFGVGSAPTAGAEATGDRSVAGGAVGAGVELGAAIVVTGVAGVGAGSDRGEHAAADVANSNDGTAARRRFALIPDLSST
jgi:hypothetical protein